MGRNKSKGFTLIELLVVISVIAVLIAIIIPALSAARAFANRVVCLTNQKGLVLSWRMYFGDNDDRLVNGGSQPNVWRPTQGGRPAGKRDSWVAPPLGEDGFPADNSTKFSTTFADRLRGLRAGTLGPYTGQATDLYHCPGDNREVVGTRHGPEPRYQIYRTYSYPFSDSLPFPGPPPQNFHY